MEAMVDRVARELGLDPVAVRRRNLLTAEMYPYTAPTGLFFEKLSHEESLDAVLELAGYPGLCAERDRLRAEGIYRGLGLCVFIDLTVPGAQTYGTGGARISSQDGTTIRLEPTGKLTVISSITEQGQGTDTILAQVAAATVGVPIGDVRVVTGDTMVTPYGGGTWGSRGAGIGGEATIQTGKALKENILKVAAVVLEVDALDLDVRGGHVVDARTGESRLPLSELGRVAYFRPDQLPKDFQSELTVTRHYTPREYGFTFTNGIQASYVEVDTDTGQVRTRVQYKTPPEARASEKSSINFHAATLLGNTLYTCTTTEVLIFRVPDFEQVGYVSLPHFNDVHHVAPSPDGNLLVVSTGLDMVVKCTLKGEVLEQRSVLPTRSPACARLKSARGRPPPPQKTASTSADSCCRVSA
jgi:hypothetical protein